MYAKGPVLARLLALGALAAAPLLVSCEPAVATFTVTTLADAVDASVGDGRCETAAGTCSLRAAIQEGNAVADPGPVDIVLEAATYDLTIPGSGEDLAATGDLDLRHRFRITGARRPGISTSIIGYPADRVFDAHPGSGLRLTDLDVGDGSAPVGGVIRATSANIDIERTRVVLGEADAGGLISVGPGTLTLTDASLEAGEADLGGAVVAARLVMARSSIVDSQAADGAAVVLTATTTSSSIEASTVARNVASAGRAVVSAGPLSIRDSAVVDNTTTAGSLAGGTPTQLANSILDAAAGPDCAAAVTSLGANVSSSSSCGLAAPADRQGAALDLLGFVPAGLGQAPSYDTPYVIDAGSGCLPADQRKLARPADGDTDGVAECDKGPLESVLSPLVLDVTSTLDAPDVEPGDGRCATTSGPCTLRAAIQETNARPTPDEVRLQGGATYGLSRPGAGEDVAATGDLDILGNLTLRAVGGQATIDANDLDRSFDVRVGTVAFRNLDIVDGTEAAGGGGIRTASGTEVEVLRTTLSANLAVGGGGGILVGGVLELDRSTLHHNGGSAGSGGGLLVLGSGEATVVNSTFNANNAVRGSAISVNRGGSISVTHATIAGNTAGVGISAGGAVSLAWSVVAGNPAGNCSTGVTSLGFNLDSGTTCGFTGAGDLAAADPLLGPLAADGGSTETMKPGVGSPTTASGLPCTVPWDQRERTRPAGAGCDRGAVEI